MPALPPEADIAKSPRHVRVVPEADFNDQCPVAMITVIDLRRIRARPSHPSIVETGPSKLENPMNYVFTAFTRHDLAINE